MKNNLRIAFYKGTRKGLQSIYSKSVRFIDGGIYSHCEMIFSDDISASASFIDGGVRFKYIDYDPLNWDIYYISDPDGNIERKSREWFVLHENDPYDICGNLRFVLGFIKHENGKQFCSEACAESLGYFDPWRYGPNGLASLAKSSYTLIALNK